MTEGCSGGWAIMHGYLAENGYIVTEECAPYVFHTKGLSCSSFSSCPGYARVSKSYELKNPSERRI
jgi:hypothetical protein